MSDNNIRYQLVVVPAEPDVDVTEYVSLENAMRAYEACREFQDKSEYSYIALVQILADGSKPAIIADNYINTKNNNMNIFNR